MYAKLTVQFQSRADFDRFVRTQSSPPDEPEPPVSPVPVVWGERVIRRRRLNKTLRRAARSLIRAGNSDRAVGSQLKCASETIRRLRLGLTYKGRR